MKILVCIKEVPDLDPEAELQIDESLAWIKEDTASRYMMNRFDEFAVEEALRIKEQFPDSRIDVLTVGPDRSHAVIRRALGMGADHGIHIVTATAGYLDPSRVSSLVAAAVAAKGYDLVFTGVMAEDTQQGQTGVMIAEQLGLPWASAVVKETILPDRKCISVEREIEGGLREVLQVTLPCLLTIQTGINQPRYPSLSKVLKAKKSELETFQEQSLDGAAAKQQVRAIGYPRKQRTGEVLQGSSQEKAQKLVAILTAKSFIQ
jgi:electron transfer flavoprotein beta subunit